MRQSVNSQDFDRPDDGAVPPVPLVVDLDDTLIRTDLLHEALIRLCALRPGAAAAALVRLRRGKAAFKAAVAMRVPLTPDRLPYNETVLDFIRAEQARGRPVYLATGSDRAFAQAVADHLGLFAGVLASDGRINLTGTRKAEDLCARFGPGGFDYIGDSHVDIPVWRRARRALLVARNARVESRLRAQVPDLTVLDRRPGGWRDYGRALRPHQWAKNSLLFLPLIAAHAFDPVNLALIALAVLAFSLVASSVYVLNDLIDLDNDRDHLRKRLRPLASGNMPVRHGAALAPLLLLGGVAAASLVSPAFLGIVLVYFLLTCAYSLYLKQLVIVDVLALAGLYTIRVMAGAVALTLPLSPWILAFCLFLFMSLALVKRYTELRSRFDAGKPAPLGRGYLLDDMPLLIALAGAAGYAAVVVLALYVNSEAVTVLYRRPEGLWSICVLLLYWISRALLIAHRGRMHDDPIVFALKDRVSLLILMLAMVAVGWSMLA